MNKKILIGIVATLIIAIGIGAFVVFKPLSEIRVRYLLNKSDAIVLVGLDNYGKEDINVTRIELIYVPEDLGIVWLEEFTIEPRKMVQSEYYPYKDYNKNYRFVQSYEMVNGASGLFELLWDSRYEDDVRIIVETTETIYTFNPSKYQEITSPSSIEKK